MHTHTQTQHLKNKSERETFFPLKSHNWLNGCIITTQRVLGWHFLTLPNGEKRTLSSTFASVGPRYSSLILLPLSLRNWLVHYCPGRTLSSHHIKHLPNIHKTLSFVTFFCCNDTSSVTHSSLFCPFLRYIVSFVFFSPAWQQSFFFLLCPSPHTSINSEYSGWRM